MLKKSCLSITQINEIIPSVVLSGSNTDSICGDKMRSLVGHLAIAWMVLAHGDAQAAEAKIIADPQSVVGQFALIDGSESTATKGLRWTIPDHGVALFTRSDSRQIVLWSAEPRHVSVLLTAIDDNGKQSSQTVTIEFVAINPEPKPPSPAPEPGPNDNPSDPHGILPEMIAKAKDVQTSDRPGDVKHMVAALESLRDDFKSGRVDATKKMQVGVAIKSRVNNLPVEIQRRWMPGFGRWWTQRLVDLYNAGKLLTNEDWGAILELTIFALKGLL